MSSSDSKFSLKSLSAMLMANLEKIQPLLHIHNEMPKNGVWFLLPKCQPIIVKSRLKI